MYVIATIFNQYLANGSLCYIASMFLFLVILVPRKMYNFEPSNIGISLSEALPSRVTLVEGVITI